MRKSLVKNLKYCIALFLFLFFFSGQPVEFGEETAFFQGFLIPKPVIRIGLGVNLSEIKISSSSGMKIYEVKTNYKLVADDIDEVLIRGQKEKLSEKYIIQVAQSEDREESEIIAQDLKAKIENKVYITKNTEGDVAGTYQVIVGDYLTRGDALSSITKLHQIGVEDTWIIREEIAEGDSSPVWILVNDELKSLNDNTVLYFIPSHAQSFLSYNGRDYRGIFILKASRKGIVLINLLNLEDYLKGVVPSELSPYAFRELEAHKAQAVAARTYATKNLELNGDLDYDLCDTPKSQFYGGMNAEHPLSNTAVEQTQGEVAIYNGKLIDALYTSTCGGMTENVEEVFKGPALPYLRSTECVYENKKEWILKSEKSVLPIYINGRNIAQEIASLLCLKVIPNEADPVFYGEQASYEEAVSWIKNALTLLGMSIDDSVPALSTLNCFTLAQLFIDYFEQQERVDNLLLEGEKDLTLRDIQQSSKLARDERAYLIQSGIFPSPKDAQNPNRILTRGDLAYYLWKVIQSYQDFVHQGIFEEFDNGNIRLEESGEDRQLLLPSNAFLIKNFSDDYSFASQLYLEGGERIRWLECEGKVLLLEIICPPQTNSLDRGSAHHSWQVRGSREELEKKINQYYPIQNLTDIIPLTRGVSKRVVELLIKGSETQVVVKGLRIRWVLGLKEMLFVIDREYDEEGHVTYFTFSGKGYGHGVGLCQVGAFRLAQEGAGYKEILKKYYQNIKISKIY